jgi:uncharacterized glyoxalase superfamily protein PhnB
MSSMSFKPSGYSSVSSYVVCDGAQRVVDFLRATFDATLARSYANEDGSLMHGEVRIDDTIVMLSDGNAKWPPFPVWLHVYVQDVDATYQRALAAGGVSVQEPVQKPNDPDRRGGVKDPSGNTWWIAQQVTPG